VKVGGPKLGHQKSRFRRTDRGKIERWYCPVKRAGSLKKERKKIPTKLLILHFFLSNERLECGGDVRWAFRPVNLTHKEGGEKVSERAVAESYESEVSQGENP